MVLKKEVMYVDMDGVLCDYRAAYKKSLIEKPEIKSPQSQPNFFRNLKPMEEGVSSVRKLMEQFDVYFLTAPSVRNPLCYTEKRLWIEDHFGFEMAKRLIISPNKGLSKGVYLIDDHIDGSGQENFEGEVIHFGKTEFPNWKSVLAYFKMVI